MGAAGVSFDGSGGSLAYHFEEEIDAQMALGTCETEHRYLVCEHTKLGRSERWRAGSLRQLLDNTKNCTIVTSQPDPSIEAQANRDPQQSTEAFDAQLENFQQLLTTLSKEGALDGKSLDLKVVNTMGEVVTSYSSEELVKAETSNGKGHHEEGQA